MCPVLHNALADRHIYIYIYKYRGISNRTRLLASLRSLRSRRSAISSFTPMANPVAKQWCSRQARGHDSCPMIAIPCQCSSERMKPSFGKANPQKHIVPLLLLVSHFIAFSATAGGHHAFTCLTRALEIEEWFSRLMSKVVPVVTSFSRMYIYRQNLGFSAMALLPQRSSHGIPILNQHII